MIPNKRTIKFDTEKEILSNNPDFTFEVGKKLASDLKPKDIIAIYGNLGAGKTCLVQGICAGLNVTGYVNSPSFTIINEYNGIYPIYHFDFYRLYSQDELYDLDLEDYFYGEGICLIEWPELAEELLPDNTKRIYIDFVDRAIGI